MKSGKREKMKVYGNSFVQSQELAKKLAIATVIFAVGSFVSIGADSAIQFSFLALTFVLCALTVYVIIRYCRCPHCGKRIYFGVLKARTCPACHRDLVNGKKTKKK